jgi:hypothetical protein
VNDLTGNGLDGTISGGLLWNNNPAPVKKEVILTVTDAAGNPSTATAYVAVEDTTDPNIILTGAATVTHNISTTYTDLGANTTDNCSATLVTTDNVNVNAVGTYTVTYTATDGSGNVTIATRTVVVGSPAPLAVNVAVYPNPSKGVFNLTFQNKDTDTNIFLFDFSGRLIEQKSITSGRASKDILIGNNTLSSGLYIIKIISGDKTIIKKVMVE